MVRTVLVGVMRLKVLLLVLYFALTSLLPKSPTVRWHSTRPSHSHQSSPTGEQPPQVLASTTSLRFTVVPRRQLTLHRSLPHIYALPPPHLPKEEQSLSQPHTPSMRMLPTRYVPVQTPTPATWVPSLNQTKATTVVRGRRLS